MSIRAIVSALARWIALPIVYLLCFVLSSGVA